VTKKVRGDETQQKIERTLQTEARKANVGVACSSTITQAPTD
jgi:hypothetical protein